MNNKAIKGLKLHNEDLKKEIEEFKVKYNQEVEDSKAQIEREIEKFAKLMPSTTLQEELRESKEECARINKRKGEELQKYQEENLKETNKIKEKYETSIQELKNTNERFVSNLEKENQKKSEIIDKEHQDNLNNLESKYSEELRLSKEEISKSEEFIKSLKDDLRVANDKVGELSKAIGRYESKEEFGEKSTSDKDNEIVSLKDQIKDLLNTINGIKTQVRKECSDEISLLQSQINEYKEKNNSLKKRHESQIAFLENKHEEEVASYKEKLNSSASVDAIQIENMTKLLKEKDSLLESTQKSYQSLLNAKSESIESLNKELGEIKEAKIEAEEKLSVKKDEKRTLVDRLKDEMQSVLSLKSANTLKDSLASREELNDNMRIINEFFDDPYSKTLKKIFKLKRLRKEDSSVDSTSLMAQNHHIETREHEEIRNQHNIEKIKEKDVNEGRVEDMAQPGGRPHPLRGSRGRGGPPPRGRGRPMPRGRARMPPRHNAPPPGNTPPKTIETDKSKNNINILDPSSKINFINF